jgi:hypothetical protein
VSGYSRVPQQHEVVYLGLWISLFIDIIIKIGIFSKSVFTAGLNRLGGIMGITIQAGSDITGDGLKRAIKIAPSTLKNVGWYKEKQ